MKKGIIKEGLSFFDVELLDYKGLGDAYNPKTGKFYYTKRQKIDLYETSAPEELENPLTHMNKYVLQNIMLVERFHNLSEWCQMNKYSVIPESFCEGLKSSKFRGFEVYDGIVNIKDSAFKDSTLSVLYFNDTSNLKSIGDRAFANTDLKDVYLPAGLEYIGRKVFTGCNSLNIVIAPAGLDNLRNDLMNSGIVLCGNETVTLSNGQKVLVDVYCRTKEDKKEYTQKEIKNIVKRLVEKREKHTIKSQEWEEKCATKVNKIKSRLDEMKKWDDVIKETRTARKIQRKQELADMKKQKEQEEKEREENLKSWGL